METLNEVEAAKIAEEAYVFGYPLVLMDVTEKVSAAVPRPEGTKAPINQFAHVPAFPDASFTDVVSPNADTLYSLAWLELSDEPVVLSLPEMGERYYLMQLVDAWTNVFAAPGTRTTGNGNGDFAMVGPGYNGSAARWPEGCQVAHEHGLDHRPDADERQGRLPCGNAIQAQYLLTPLSAWGKAYTPPGNVPVAAGAGAKAPPSEQVARMEAATFFGRLNALMKNNPPALADAPALARFLAIGVVAGKEFARAEPAVAAGIEHGVRAAREKVDAEAKKLQSKVVNGWAVFTENVGRYGTGYLLRAAVARLGIGTNLPEDAVYPLTRVDADGRPLTGAHRYVLRFAKGQLPPVSAFWSVTLYNSKQAFVDNPIDRYAIGDRDNSDSMRMAGSRSICSTTHRARTRNRTGFPRGRTSSISSSGCTGRSRRSSTAHGNRQRSNESSKSNSIVSARADLTRTIPIPSCT